MESESDVRVTEVRLHGFLMCENGRRKKILGCITRGGDSESDVGVGVPLEFRLHRFKKS